MLKFLIFISFFKKNKIKIPKIGKKSNISNKLNIKYINFLANNGD